MLFDPAPIVIAAFDALMWFTLALGIALAVLAWYVWEF